MTRPNFFILGAPKCGTTSLASWLAQHHNVFMSAHKEPHYFNTDDTFRFYHKESEYLSLFSDADSRHLAIGEASTWYLFSQEAVRNIEKFTNLSAKYIVCIRDPVEMVQSLHGQMLLSGNETQTDFLTAWDLQELRSKGKGISVFSNAPLHLQYKDACSLGSQLLRLFTLVPRERIHLIFLEDIKANPQRVYEDLLTFLNLPKPAHKIEFTVQNKSNRPRSYAITFTVRCLAFVRRKLNLKRGFGLLTLLRRVNRTENQRVTLTGHQIRKLRVAFEQDIRLLEKLTNRDLSHWKNDE